MTDLRFEGYLDDTSEIQLKYIQNVLETLGYTNEKIVLEAVGSPGDGLKAYVKRVIVEKDGESFKMIAKLAPTLETMRPILNSAMLFQNEHYMYTKVLPKISEMLITAEILEDERLKYATCYGSFMEAPNEVILLEDLKESNFKMLERFKPLPSESIKLVLKNLAILHSFSFALKHRETETYEEFDKGLQNMFLAMTDQNPMQVMFEKFEEDALSILDDEKYKKLVRRSVSQMIDMCKKNAVIDRASRFSVILHGDLWTNNIMFKSEDDKELKCCMIDYQNSRTGSPVIDLHYIIFNCSDYESRTKHFNEWIGYYHSELDKNLSNFGLKSNYVYSREQLDTDMRRYAKCSLSIAITMSGMMVMNTAEAAKIKDAVQNDTPIDAMIDQVNVSTFDEQTILMYKNRITEVINSFLELGFLL